MCKISQGEWEAQVLPCGQALDSTCSNFIPPSLLSS